MMNVPSTSGNLRGSDARDRTSDATQRKIIEDKRAGSQPNFQKLPKYTLFSKGQNVRATTVTTNRASLQISRHDPVRQRVKSQHVMFVNDQARLFPVEVRYAWPSELDLMAQLAGLRLRHRWEGWRRGEVTESSPRHISGERRSGGR